MSDAVPPPFESTPTPEASAPPPPPPPSYGAPVPAAPAYAAPMGYAPTAGPVGKVRSTGVAILLYVVTFGIYGLYWWYATHEEMKRHSGSGIGGLVALLIAFFVSPVMAFLTPAEVGGLYERSGQPKPVSGVTGLWLVIGWIILVGPIVWFVKTNGALNAYWRSQGAQG